MGHAERRERKRKSILPHADETLDGKDLLKWSNARPFGANWGAPKKRFNFPFLELCVCERGGGIEWTGSSSSGAGKNYFFSKTQTSPKVFTATDRVAKLLARRGTRGQTQRRRRSNGVCETRACRVAWNRRIKDGATTSCGKACSPAAVSHGKSRQSGVGWGQLEPPSPA